VFRPAMRGYMHLYHRSRSTVHLYGGTEAALVMAPTSRLALMLSFRLDLIRTQEAGGAIDCSAKAATRHPLICLRRGVKPMRLILRKDRGGVLRYYIN